MGAKGRARMMKGVKGKRDGRKRDSVERVILLPRVEEKREQKDDIWLAEGRRS